MSVAQTTSNATAELGLNMPAMKVQDIFTEAMLYPKVTKALLQRPPKTESDARRFFGSIPAIFYTSGIRGVTESIKQTETGPIAIDDYVEEVYRETVPQPEPTIPEPRTTGPLTVQNNNPGNLRLAGQPGAPLAQAAPLQMPPAPPAPASITPQSLARTAQILGPQDEIGMLASEMLMRQRPV